MLWLDPGLGKTAITLTSIAHLIGSGFMRGVIIVAPIRLIRLVWRQEASKWEHTKHLKFSMVTGTKDQRTRALLQGKLGERLAADVASNTGYRVLGFWDNGPRHISNALRPLRHPGSAGPKRIGGIQPRLRVRDRPLRP